MEEEEDLDQEHEGESGSPGEHIVEKCKKWLRVQTESTDLCT